jgi:hypothetical protein
VGDFLYKLFVLCVRSVVYTVGGWVFFNLTDSVYDLLQNHCCCILLRLCTIGTGLLGGWVGVFFFNHFLFVTCYICCVCVRLAVYTVGGWVLFFLIVFVF